MYIPRYAKMGEHSNSRGMEIDDEAAELIIDTYTRLRSLRAQER
jgi:hypothetical protein